MRYAVFSDIHANLEALEAVLAKIDELAKDEPIDHIWFLGDLVGYGPNPNECIAALRKRTDVIIAGNHDWAAVGKIDLEDFSAAARISAEWTAEQLTKENREFLINLPERIEIDECTLVHGSPYGPLWEYLTSEALAERSFQCFGTRFCFIGHTHVPIIFQQLDPIANTPTVPLTPNDYEHADSVEASQDRQHPDEESYDSSTDDDETTELAAIRPTPQAAKAAAQAEKALIEKEVAESVENAEHPELEAALAADEIAATKAQIQINNHVVNNIEENANTETAVDTEEVQQPDAAAANGVDEGAKQSNKKAEPKAGEVTPEETIANAEDRLNNEIEELLALLGLSQSMVKVTNEMIIPPEGDWQAPEGYRALVNPGGVGQPRDGDPRAAFMIYDTEGGFTFYRISYPFDKTQEKIIKAGLPHYLAVRLAYGR